MWKLRNAKDVTDQLGLVSHPEQGYFIETYRSGSLPMKSQGQTNFDVPTRYKRSRSRDRRIEIPDNLSYEALSLAPGRESRRTDGDIRRNCLTSIIYMPTADNLLPLAVNLSDHVHYFHGGCPFKYVIYNPKTETLTTEVLGSDFQQGQKLQIPVPGGCWKGGHVLKTPDCEFSLIGEAVAPGFDFHDFSWITEADLSSVKDDFHRITLAEYLHKEADDLSGKEVEDAKRYYDNVYPRDRNHQQVT